MGAIDWTTTIALIGMSVVMVCTTAVCVVLAATADWRTREARRQRYEAELRAFDVDREVQVLRAKIVKIEADSQRRIQRWRGAYIELRMQALEAVRVFGWHAEDLPREPLDTALDDMSETIPGEQQA